MIDYELYCKIKDYHQKADTSRIPPLTAEPVIPDPVYRWEQGYCGRDEEEQNAILQRDHAQNLITGTPYWWFDIRSHNYQEPFIVETREAPLGDRQAGRRLGQALAQRSGLCLLRGYASLPGRDEWFAAAL